jgi:hypothetical protein
MRVCEHVCVCLLRAIFEFEVYPRVLLAATASYDTCAEKQCATEMVKVERRGETHRDSQRLTETRRGA